MKTFKQFGMLIFLLSLGFSDIAAQASWKNASMPTEDQVKDFAKLVIEETWRRQSLDYEIVPGSFELKPFSGSDKFWTIVASALTPSTVLSGTNVIFEVKRNSDIIQGEIPVAYFRYCSEPYSPVYGNKLFVDAVNKYGSEYFASSLTMTDIEEKEDANNTIRGSFGAVTAISSLHSRTVTIIIASADKLRSDSDQLAAVINYSFK